MSETIIPDMQGQSNEGIKLNLKNLFTFLSSLDYIKAIETSRALDTIDSRQFFFTAEKQSLLLFVYTHTSFWVFIAYLVIILTADLVFDIHPVLGVLSVSFIWLLFGIWFVNRYTWGNGYLWQIARDFMINLTISTIIISFTMDFIILYVLPFLYKTAVDWLQSGPKDGFLNAFAESALIWIESIIKPILDKVSMQVSTFLPVFLSISIFKSIAFLIPTLLMFYLHKKRKNLKKRLNELLKDIS